MLPMRGVLLSTRGNKGLTEWVGDEFGPLHKVITIWDFVEY